MKPQRQKRGEGSVPTWSASPACIRAGDAGALALGGISRPTYSQMLWRMEEWKAPLSLPLIPRKAFFSWEGNGCICSAAVGAKP